MDTAQPEFEYLIEGLDPLEHALRRLEAMEDVEGWDRKPVFYAFIAAGDLPDIKGTESLPAGLPIDGMLGVGEMTFPSFCYDHPAMGLPIFYKMLMGQIPGSEKESILHSKDTLKAINNMVPSGFYGFGLMYEGWTLPHSVPEEERRARSAAGTMDEHPDRVEIRSICVATRDGRFVSIVRHRGEVPSFEEYDPTTMTVEGRIPWSVRMFTSLFERFDSARHEYVESLEGKESS